MGKGGSSAPTTTYAKTETSNLPEYAKPYYEKLMSNASGMTLGSDYQPYGGQRIADFTPAQQWAMNNNMQATTPDEFNNARDLTNYAAAGLGSISQYNPSNFSSQQIGSPNLYNYDMQSPGNVSGTNTQAAQMRGPADVQWDNYTSPQMGNYSMQGPADVQAQNYNSPEMTAAQTNYGDQLKNLNSQQIGAPDVWGQKQADQYMSPYQQSVVDIQKREATRDAKKGQLVEDLGAARQGTYGGSRQLLAGLERERNLGQQVGDIQQKGSQAAYENAQQQFERDRAAGLDISKANQQAGLSTQQLGTQAGLQAALANLDADSQSRVQNLAAQLQTQGLNADQALKAAMSNQQTALSTGQSNLQAGLTSGQANLSAQQATQGLNADATMKARLANQQTGFQTGQQNMNAQNTMLGMNSDNYMKAQLANQQMGFNVNQANQQGRLGVQQLGAQTGLDALKSNQQYDLEAQRLAEQSRQFGAGQTLQGWTTMAGLGQTMANIGQSRGNYDQSLRDSQLKTATLDQALQQSHLDQQYGDYLRQQGYPLEMLQQYSSLLRGVPVTPSTQTQMQQPSPNLASQILGTGVGALGAYKSLSG